MFLVNGERQWINCRNNTREDINKWVNLLKGQNGDTSTTVYRKMWHTDQPSIQGAWTPFTGKNPAHNLVEFPKIELAGALNQEQTATEELMKLYQADDMNKKESL